MPKESRRDRHRRPILATVAILATMIVLGACSSSGTSTSPDTTKGAVATSAAGAVTDGGSGSGTPRGSVVGGKGQTVKVSIANFAFDPHAIEVAAGTTIEWTNDDTAPHTATSTQAPKSFDSKDLAKGETYSETFTEPGTYQYYCQIHNYMTGTITVD